MNNGFSKFDLTGKTALVTGGATGLGLEMTRALLQSGAKVMMAARRENILKQVAQQISEELGVDTLSYHCVDLSRRDSVQALADHVIATFGGLDIFIGNAGMEAQQRIEDITDQAMDDTLRINLSANIELTRAFLPHMRKNKWGRIIYSSSEASEFGSDDVLSVYGAAKSGLNAFARSVACEAGYDGITANTLVIGVFLTDMAMEHLNFEELGEEGMRELMEKYISMVPLRRPGMPSEIGGLIQLLASDAGSYISGVSIPIDGGWSAMMKPSERPPLPVAIKP